MFTKIDYAQKKISAPIIRPHYQKGPQRDKQCLYTSDMILRKVPHTALIITLWHYYIRGYLPPTGNHFNITEESNNFLFYCPIKSFQWCLNHQVISQFKYHYDSIILGTYLNRMLSVCMYIFVMHQVVCYMYHKSLSCKADRLLDQLCTLLAITMTIFLLRNQPQISASSQKL